MGVHNITIDSLRLKPDLMGLTIRKSNHLLLNCRTISRSLALSSIALECRKHAPMLIYNIMSLKVRLGHMALYGFMLWLKTFILVNETKRLNWIIWTMRWQAFVIYCIFLQPRWCSCSCSVYRKIQSFECICKSNRRWLCFCTISKMSSSWIFNFANMYHPSQKCACCDYKLFSLNIFSFLCFYPFYLHCSLINLKILYAKIIYNLP